MGHTRQGSLLLRLSEGYKNQPDKMTVTSRLVLFYGVKYEIET